MADGLFANHGSFQSGRTRRSGLTRIEIVAIAFAVVMVATTAVLVSRGGREAVSQDRTVCLARLTEVGRALDLYFKDSGDRWPYVAKLPSIEARRHDPPWPSLPAVLAPYMDKKESFRCPADRRTLPVDSALAGKFPTETTFFDTEGLSYEWLFAESYGGQKRGDETMSKASGFSLGPPDQPVLRDFDLFHAGGGGGPYNTLFADLRARPAKTAAGD